MKYIIDVSRDRVSKNGKLQLLCEIENSLPQYVHTAIDAEPYKESSRKAIEDEVWEFVKEIECLTRDEAEDCFDVEYDGIPFVANMFSYQEAKAKFEAWLKQRDEIRVGDEVVYRGNKYVVGYVGADEVYHIVDRNWIRVVVQGDYQIFKTGRHFPEVAELLQKMRGEEQ